ncbi:hypothetical protein RFI_04294 [Reticulomyxa filosa]|uniref:Uncharacterized protein n=1 Tax=Reticulomyxa filosa TaxID=46433 RepID=X6P5E6_RETFI|nr:hypothetical protein RFI_04294 [Reticulomyxa filosa]|eukprot:ETO32822.1 hypothetical protein RFI_04294 [Reticulomyxa filosa]
MRENTEIPHAPTREKVNEEKPQEQTILVLKNEMKSKNEEIQKKTKEKRHWKSSIEQLIRLITDGNDNIVCSNDKIVKRVLIVALNKRYMLKNPVVFYSDKKIKICIIPDPDEKIRYSGIRMIKEKVEIVNISERVMVRIDDDDEQHVYESASGTIRVHKNKFAPLKFIRFLYGLNCCKEKNVKKSVKKDYLLVVAFPFKIGQQSKKKRFLCFFFIRIYGWGGESVFTLFFFFETRKKTLITMLFRFKFDYKGDGKAEVEIIDKKKIKNKKKKKIKNKKKKINKRINVDKTSADDLASKSLGKRKF